ncbi:MAG: bifunctional phosphoribosylaminoimidazolecarboxamide formyltransferase/IMP cyclohydrolase [Candidatus Rokubacteria bacterium]|nr:bifunctional phosphoribosylaminoimidazolecarboxamide formyltransferase/IMP cyclohydrolase [Candidatus Rokubacteria bacterium]MBI3827228.1 bifunctional phosphoribosylaminoimidazolecarboxamide formyltransferase/IMP cyclohydrolase [Candidatus Rokubacteria bacterium]
MKVRRALVSVSDKTGVVDLARVLAKLGVEILSTGGTARLLREAGLPVREVAEVTGFPEMLDGRVKTLHPKIHGGILARRDLPEHVEALDRHGIPPIDLVVVSLYPFEATVARAGVTLSEAIEQIDVGGPTMIRAAAKNWTGVAVVTDAAQYAAVSDELASTGGTLSEATRWGLAREAFQRTAQYDAAISRWLATREAAPGTPAFPAALRLEATRALSLKYGENPHQSAAFYRPAAVAPAGLGAMQQLHGPELGYNNLLDFSAALGLLLEFPEPAAVVIKHTNPCGVAVAASVGEATARAKACDPVSIYGGIVGINRECDMAVVAALAGIFVEILFAPSFAPDALEELRRTKKKARVIEVPCRMPADAIEYRSVLGGLLAQSADTADLDEGTLKVVTRRAPTADETAALRFGWRVAKHAKSNAIVLAARDQVVGVGAGQMNRVDSARLAVSRAREVGLATDGCVCASDAFFPFRDGLDVVAAAGARAVIQPGGSLRDDEVVAAADSHDMAMVFTGIRHFRH